MKVISEGRTWFYKRVLPVIMFLAMGGFIAVIFVASRKPNGPPLPVVFFPLVMLGFFYLLMKKLVFDLADEVQDCGDYLVIRFKNQEEQVFLSNIMNVSYSYLNPPRVTLTLRQPCRFGKEVVFCPLTPFSDFTKSLHFRNSVVEDLIERVDTARRR